MRRCVEGFGRLRGTVEQVTYDSSGRPYLRVHVRFEVTEPFIGMEGRGKQVEVLTGSGGGDCGFPFHCGHSYLVYAYQSQESQLATGICSAPPSSTTHKPTSPTYEASRTAPRRTFTASQRRGEPAAL